MSSPGFRSPRRSTVTPSGSFNSLGPRQTVPLTRKGATKPTDELPGDATVREMMPILLALEVDKSPFELGDVPKKTRDIHWTRPRLVADVEMAELTASGKLRQASFKGLRADKTANELRTESMGT